MSEADDEQQQQRWRSYLWASDTGKPMLQNLYGLRDPEQLREREYSETARRTAEILLGRVEIPRTGDWAEWQAIHRHLFAEIYPWAGLPRQVRMWKNDKEFLRPHDYVRFLPEVFQRAQTADWAPMRRPEFVETVARLYMDLNWAHPFREGNGRTLRLFLDRITATARWRLDYSRVDADTWDIASHHSRPAGYHRPTQAAPMLRVFAQITAVRDTAPGRASDPADPRDLEQIIEQTLTATDHSPAPSTPAAGGAATTAAIEAAGMHHPTSPAATPDLTSPTPSAAVHNEAGPGL